MGAAAIIPAVLAGVGAISGAIGSFKESQSIEHEQEQAKELAKRERQLGQEQRNDFRRQTSAQRSRSIALQGSRGVEPFEGTPSLLNTQTFREMLLGEQRILNQSEANATEYENRADTLGYEAQQKRYEAVVKFLLPGSAPFAASRSQSLLSARTQQPTYPTSYGYSSSGRNPHTGGLIVSSSQGRLGGGT